MSIVKELDKISGTDTRSKNIEDAVKKLELGGGTGGIGIVNITLSIDAGDVEVLADKTYSEVAAMWDEGPIFAIIHGSNQDDQTPTFVNSYHTSDGRAFGVVAYNQYYISVTSSDGWTVTTS